MPAPSLEADLRAAREAAGVSIEQIQQETRIPADVVERFEAGKLLTDPAFNEVYRKAFLRAYAGAVGLSPNRVVDAYGAYQAGAYGGGLHAGTPDALAPDPPPAASAATPVSEGVPRAVAPPVVPPASAERAPAVAALSRGSESEMRPFRTEGPPEHLPRRRVASAATAGAPHSFDRAWRTIIGATVATVLVVAVVLWLLFRDTTPEPEVVEAVAADTTDTTTVAADTTAPAPAATTGPPFALPIRVTVIAGGDGLQGFRATELPGDRRPYWVDVGDELVLESNEGVILWGGGREGLEPAEVTLRWQGFQWRPVEGQVLRITPQNGQRLLDSLHTAGVPQRSAATPAP